MEACLGLKMAATFLMNGDTSNYVRLCNNIERIRLNKLRSLFVERRATILLMRGILRSPSQRQLAIASMQYRTPPQSGEILYYWWHNAKAMADFWNGDYEACLDSCRIAKTSRESKCRVRGWTIEGMAEARSGDRQGAADAIRIARATLQDEDAQADGDYRWNWHDVPIAILLTRQAQALLDSQP